MLHVIKGKGKKWLIQNEALLITSLERTSPSQRKLSVKKSISNYHKKLCQVSTIHLITALISNEWSVVELLSSACMLEPKL